MVYNGFYELIMVNIGNSKLFTISRLTIKLSVIINFILIFSQEKVKNIALKIGEEKEKR